MIDPRPSYQTGGKYAVLVRISWFLDTIGGHQYGAGEGVKFFGLILPGTAVMTIKMGILFKFRIAVAGQHFTMGIDIDILALGLP